MAKDSSSGSSGRLGELLVREKLITPLQLQGAVEQQRKSGGRLGHHLTKLGYVQENELTAFLSQQYGVRRPLSIERLRRPTQLVVSGLVSGSARAQHGCST